MDKNEENFDLIYKMIMDNTVYSHSALTTYENCKYCYKLTYVDKKPRINNFFAEYGLLIHECIEKYFKGELDSYELSDYFTRNYMSSVVSPPPPFPAGMEERYIEQGQLFFDTFYFPLDDYEILGVENEVHFEIAGLTLTGRPDLVLKEKDTGEVVLLDYKTSMPFRYSYGRKTVDKPKVDGYFRQMYLYCYGLRKDIGIKIDKITLWFPRAADEITRKWQEEEELAATQWAETTIKQIREERDFPYNISNSYFCNFLCGVREDCEYRELIQ
jgi:hypothetical protein